MRFAWIGSHVEGRVALQAVLEAGYRPEAFFTLRPKLAAKRSGAADYRSLCREFGVPVYEIGNINDDESRTLLEELSLDVTFVIGWSQIVRPEALRLTRVGMIGAHASLLPHNRGRAPVNWVLINGERETGNSLIWLAEDVDAGNIIDQTAIPITPYDTCASLYGKVAESNKEMIFRVLPKLLAGERPGRPQPIIDEPNLPGRRPEDGLIDWNKSATDIYNFVRAQTRPYPGAFSWLDDTRWRLWHCAVLEEACFPDAAPGQIVSPVYSSVDCACGQAVACGQGAILILEIEDDNGEVLSGHRLSDCSWKHKVWKNEP